MVSRQLLVSVLVIMVGKPSYCDLKLVSLHICVFSFIKKLFNLTLN